MADALTNHLAALDDMLARLREMTAEANAAVPQWHGQDRRCAHD